MNRKKSIESFCSNIKYWIISYVIVLMIPIIICSFFFLYSYQIIWEETKDSNTVALRKIVSELDDIFEKTFYIEYAIHKNSDIREAVIVKQPLNADKRYSLLKAVKAAGNCVGDEVISSWFIYYPNSEMTLIGSGYIDQEDFYERQGKNYGYTYEEWDALLKQRNNKKFLINSETGEIGYITTLPLHQIAVNMNLIMGLNDNYIQEILSGLDDMKGGIFLMDTENEVLISRNMEQIDIENLSEKIVMGEEYWPVSLDGEKMLVCCIQLERADLRVLSVIPYKIFWSTALRSLVVFYGVLVLCIVTGLAVSYLFSVRKHRVWGKLNAIAKSRRNSSGNNKISFNKEVSVAIEAIVKEYDSMQKQLASVDTLKRELLISSILKGRIRAEEIELVLKKNGVSFEIGNYAVILFKLNSFECFYDANEQEGCEQDIHLIKQAVMSTVQELNQEFVCEILNVDEKIVCIVDFGSLDKEECYEHIAHFAQRCRSLFKERIGNLLTISISDIHKYVFSLQNAYYEAFRVMEYQIAMGNELVMNYTEMTIKTQISYFYSLENERAFIHWILEGKEKEALQLFEEIYEKNLLNVRNSEELDICLKWNLIASILRAESELRERIALSNTQNFLDSIKTEVTLYEAKFILTERIKQICQEVSKTKVTKGDFLAEKVKEYIQENYADPNLSNSKIAGCFRINATYLSTFFKEKTGMNVLSYIHQVRLNKAKELLKTTDLTLEEICCRVGCSNSVSLTRLFKKYENVTPAAYRKKGLFGK